MIDGKKQKPYDGIWNIAFSPDSKRVGYSAFVKHRRFVVIDGKEGAPYQYYASTEAGPIFSPDSRRIAYVTSEAKSGLMKVFWVRSVVVDETRHNQYDTINSLPIFSPDSSRVAYIAGLEKKQFVVVDGVPSAPYDHIETQPLFSPDGAHITYAAQSEQKHTIVLDNKEINHCDGIVAGTLVYSPDGKQRAYATLTIGGKSGTTATAVIAGKEQRQYNQIAINSLIFSPDGKRVAYAGQTGDKWFLNVDGKEQKQYNEIQPGSLVFSPDSKRLALVGGNLLWVKMKSHLLRLVAVDGQDGKYYDHISTGPVFSPNSKHIAYVAQIYPSGHSAGADRTVKYLAVVDEKEGQPYDHIEENTLVFSPDSHHLAYIAQIGGRSIVVADGTDSQDYDEIISQNGRFMSFDTPDKFRYLALQGEYLYLVEETIK